MEMKSVLSTFQQSLLTNRDPFGPPTNMVFRRGRNESKTPSGFVAGRYVVHNDDTTVSPVISLDITHSQSYTVKAFP